MISHKYKCIFIHIPKCAGTSIETALGHFDEHEGRGGQDHRTIRMLEHGLPTIEKLTSIENILELLGRYRYKFGIKVKNSKNRETVDKEQFSNYFKFTFVRNPWARAYSWYKNVMRDPIHMEKLNIKEDIAFNEFLNLNIGKGMLRPQTYWLKNFKGEIDLDYVGKFENLKEDFEQALELMGAQNIELPHKIGGANEDFKPFYDQKSQRLIAEYYAEEIKLFNYSFE